MARPSKYTEALAKTICKKMAAGDSLNKICKSDKIPSITTVFNWLADGKHLEFLDKYNKAREQGLEKLAEDILNIADATENDIVEDEDGNVKVNHNVVQRDKLRVDARKWLLSKQLPKKYGDKVSQEISGPDGGPVPTKFIVNFVDAKKEGK